MKCPNCNGLSNKVIDSRLTQENSALRRRRECEECGGRFSTYELIAKSDNDSTNIYTDFFKVVFGLELDSIGGRIRLLRFKKGLTIEKLAEFVDMDTSTLKKAETCNMLSVINLKSISNYFHVPLNYIVYGEEIR